MSNFKIPSDDGHTDIESTTTGPAVIKGTDGPKENCVSLDVTKKPLMDDVNMITEEGGFMKLLGTAMGSSKSGGWGNYGEELESSTKQVPFNEALSVKKFNMHKATYETCTQNRINEEQTIKYKDTDTDTDTKVLGLGLGEPYNFPHSSEINNLFEQHFTKNKDDEECPSYILLTALGEYLKKDKSSIETEYDRIMDIKDDDTQVFDKTKLDSDITHADGDYTHKMLFCFAWDYCGGNSVSVSGGADEVVIKSDKPENTGSHKSKYKLIYVICIMGYIYFMFVLFEAFRLLIATVNRVLDARYVYLDKLPADGQPDLLGDNDVMTEYLSYLGGFFTIMYEAGAGNLISIIEGFQETAILNAKSILVTVATEGGRTQYNRCLGGWFSCINGYLTGSSESESRNIMRITAESQLNIKLNESITEIKLSFSRITADMDFATKGFTTGINGMACCTVMLGNLIAPEKYTIAHVTASVAALQSSYTGGVTIGSMAALTQFGILFKPQTLIENNPHNMGASTVSDSETNEEKGGKRKTSKRLLDIFGGKGKTSKKRKRRKTLKKKKKKRK